MPHPAIIFSSASRVEIRDLAVLQPRPGELQVRTTVSTISAGTEGWCLQGRFGWTAVPFPCVPGYQRVGIVTSVGDDVRSHRVGARVMAVGGEWDGPIASFWGGHAVLANVPESRLFALPDGMSDSDAACLVVAQVGYNAAHRPTIAPGDWVLVYGDGLVGQFGAQAARARGARVILVGHREDRLRLAAAHAADAVLDAREPAFAGAVRARTGGEPVAAVIDTIQAEAAQLQYLALLEPGHGQVVFSGHNPERGWDNVALLQQRELTAHFVAGWTRPRMEATLALLAAGQMAVKPLITHRAAFTEAPRMYRMIIEKSEPFLGIEFEWPELTPRPLAGGEHTPR